MANWINTSLENLFSFVIGGDWGKDLNYDEPDFTEAYCIRGSEIRDWNKEKGKTAALRKIAESSLAKRKLQKGDILIEISGGGPDQPVGRTVFIDNDCLAFEPGVPKVCTNFLRLIRLVDTVDKKYINFYLTYFYHTGEVVNYQGGSNNLRNLRFAEYARIGIPLAPLPEQKRIVAKLDTLFDHLDQLKSRFEKIPNLLKQFRQAVLTQAITGKLTEEWREGKKLESWKVTSIGNVVVSLDQGWSPKCESFPASSEEKWGVIKTTSVQSMLFLEEENKQLPSSLKPRKNLELQRGDLLITRAGPRIRVGICCLVKSTRQKLMICDKVYRLRFDSAKINSGFIEALINSPEKVTEIDELKTGISDSGLNLTQDKIKKLEFLIPSLEEQNEIVRRVESLFHLADRIEASYKTLQEKIDGLPQAILSKAFRGQLTN